MADLEFDSAVKVYRSGGRDLLAVDNLNLRVNDGEIVGLLGSSGCGKTTTLRAAAGFVKLTSGAIRAGGAEIHNRPPARRGVAMAFEGYALYPPLSVRENIAFALSRGRRAAAGRAAGEVAAMLEIGGILDEYPAAVSAGQQQRAGLARALVRRAPVTLLDEPLSQLEPRLRALLRARVREYLARNRMTAVFVTHDQNEAVALADRIAVMEKGALLQLAAPSELKERPANLFVAGFIGEPPMNILPADIARNGEKGETIAVSLRGENGPAGRFSFAAGRAAFDPAALPPGPVSVGIRPHRLRLCEGGAIRARVSSSQWLGDQSHVLLESGGLKIVAATADAGWSPPRPGESVGLDFPPEALAVFNRDGDAIPFREAA